MTKLIEAIYEKDGFKPLNKVDLKEREGVRIRIEKRGIYDIIKEYRKYFEDIEEDLIVLRERGED
jgi:predicted DNA-binding antitoxin AbrB/MazE fold protein